MAVTDDELHWLQKRWSHLRDRMVAIMMRHCEPLVADIAANGRASDGPWQSFTTSVIADFRDGLGANLDLFGTALDLFAEPTPLREILDGASATLREAEGGGLYVFLLKRGLTRMRDIRLGGTEHRGKTWGRLDRISADLARQQAEATGYDVERCSMDHFIDLLGHLREYHAANRNLPRTLTAIEEYFHAFCADCRPQLLDEETTMGRMEAPRVASLPDLAAQGYNLELCVDGLEGEEREFVRVKFHLSNPIELSVLSYCTRLGIERRRFTRVIDSGLIKLRDCLTGKIESAFDTSLGYRSAWQDMG